MTRDQRSGASEHAGLSLHREVGGATPQSEISYPFERDRAASIFCAAVLVSPLVILAICVSVIRYFG